MTESFNEMNAPSISMQQFAGPISTGIGKREELKSKTILDLNGAEKYSLELSSEMGLSNWLHALFPKRCHFEMWF